jgi:hypothetical protein
MDVTVMAQVFCSEPCMYFLRFPEKYLRTHISANRGKRTKPAPVGNVCIICTAYSFKLLKPSGSVCIACFTIINFSVVPICMLRVVAP